jgi:hypothetical protein
MVDGGVSPADEQMVARFSGRVDYRVGRFLGRPHADLWVWDEESGAILGSIRSGASAPLLTLLQSVADEERSLVGDAFRAAVEHGDPIMVSCRLHSCGGSNVRSVLIAAEMSDDEPKDQSALPRTHGLAAAAGPWLAGQILDLTMLRLGATRAAANHAVSEATRHRAVIEQAKGILMVTHRIDADTAFGLLRHHSQTTNTKVHELAAHLVSHVTTSSPAAAAAPIDALLHRPELAGTTVDVPLRR